MRTTIELKDKSRAKLMEIAATRGEKGFSRLINDAVDLYLETAAADLEKRQAAVALRGCLSRAEARDLASATKAVRESWR